MTKRVFIVGSGQRVRETALPAIGASDAWTLAGIASRTAKQIESNGDTHEVVTLDSLTAESLAQVDLIYLVVSKPAVPTVLAHLAPLVAEHTELLIETPVMLFKHFGHLGKLDAFSRVWVSEDCYTLPCWDPLRATGEQFTHAHFDRSAYAYHGIAMARAVLGNARVSSARADAQGRQVQFAHGGSITTREPRDYSVGHLIVEGPGLPIADHDPGRPHRRLSAIVENDALGGFKLDDDLCELSEVERAIVGEPGAGDGIFRWMNGMKRVGFLRLLDELGAGRPAYELNDALEDATVDYWLHRLRRYRATPFSDPRCAPARLSYRLLTAVASLRGS